MNFAEYRAFDAIGLTEMLARKETTPVELMDIAVEAAQTLGEPLNAITFERYEAAKAEVRTRIDGSGKFEGIPFLLKDSGLAAIDLPSSIGSSLFEHTTYEKDSTLVKRFREAGFVSFARSTVPEFCMAPTTEARRNGGPTRNPFDPTRSAGGSSGGAAVAVACGIVPIAHGSDGGGSIRIPASCCGIFGLKPSRGRVPMGPFRGEGWGGLACDGVLTRSVRDTARALDSIAGDEPGGPYAAPGWGEGYEALLERPILRPLRIKVWGDPWGQPVDPVCKKALDECVGQCEALGHEVRPVEPPKFNYDRFIDDIITVMAANVVVAIRSRLAGEGREPTDNELEPAMMDAYRRGLTLSAAEYVLAINRFHGVGRMMDAMMNDCDIIMTPTLTEPPVKLGRISMEIPDFAEFRREAGKVTPFLAVINASGQPAASVPVWRSNGLPIGVQLIGRFGREDQVLQMSADLETTLLWKNAARWPS